jgi:hypothetical protein
MTNLFPPAYHPFHITCAVGVLQLWGRTSTRRRFFPAICRSAVGDDMDGAGTARSMLSDFSSSPAFDGLPGIPPPVMERMNGRGRLIQVQPDWIIGEQAMSEEPLVSLYPLLHLLHRQKGIPLCQGPVFLGGR